MPSLQRFERGIATRLDLDPPKYLMFLMRPAPLTAGGRTKVRRELLVDPPFTACAFSRLAKPFMNTTLADLVVPPQPAVVL